MYLLFVVLFGSVWHVVLHYTKWIEDAKWIPPTLAVFFGLRVVEMGEWVITVDDSFRFQLWGFVAMWGVKLGGENLAIPFLAWYFERKSQNKTINLSDRQAALGLDIDQK